MPILYPKSLANLVVELGIRPSHQILLLPHLLPGAKELKSSILVSICAAWQPCRGCPVSGPCSRIGSGISQHAGGSTSPASRLRVPATRLPQRAGGERCVWWRCVARRGGNLHREIFHRKWARRASGTGSQLLHYGEHRKISYISRTKSQSLNVSRLILQLSLCSLLKPGVMSRMKM